ncbi:MAG TPA: hypothetical protein VFO19_00045 [Vicinamibacterales bacterium]|nr:hypothetical protein [Vicinamibacterales bacterium]
MSRIHVRMRVFSGLRDPEWEITRPGDVARVQRWFANNAARRGGRPAGRSERDQRAVQPPVTGFRGFDVTMNGRTMRVYRNNLPSLPAAATSAETIDNILFSTNAEVLAREFGLTPMMMLSDEVHAIDGLPPTCDTSDLELGSTHYRPSSWMPDPFCDNTCYGYAANVKTESVVTPDDSQRQNWSKSELRAALADDGAGPATTAVPSARLDSPDVHYMVAVIQPLVGGRGDFHFLRLDRSGCWSHKVSTDPVKQVDDQDKKLTNLCQARFRTPFVFVGFFVVNEDLRDLLRERGQA